MKKVSDILIRKGANIISVAEESTVIDALRIMAENNIGSVLVMKDGAYAGIVTERDYSRKVALNGRSSTDTPVKEIMSTDLPMVNPTDSIEHCMHLMTVYNVRYLPVFNDKDLVGIISINDVVKETMLSQQETITNLQEYLYSNS